MPILTVSVAALGRLGANLDGVETLDENAKRRLGGLSMSRDFSMDAAIRVMRLPADAGFVLTQS